MPNSCGCLTQRNTDCKKPVIKNENTCSLHRGKCKRPSNKKPSKKKTSSQKQLAVKVPLQKQHVTKAVLGWKPDFTHLKSLEKVNQELLNNKNQLPLDLLSRWPILSCVVKEIAPWYPSRILGAGGQGVVFEVCKKHNECVAVVKISQKLLPKSQSEPQSNEGFIASKAGKLGIGPIIYQWGRCKNKTKQNVVTDFIVMEKLSGPTLEASYPYKSEDIIAALNLYYNLLVNHNILHRDFKASNLMFNENRLYLIDYGVAVKFDISKITKKELANIMFSDASVLGNTLIGKFESKYFLLDQNMKQRAQMFRLVWNSIQKWCNSHLEVPGIRNIQYSVEDDINPLIAADVEFKEWWNKISEEEERLLSQR